MSAQHEALRAGLKALTRPDFAAVVATVLKVDRAALTCDVVPAGGGAEILGVRLRAAINGSTGGLVLVPVVGSVVVVATLNNNWNSPYLALVSELDLLTVSTTHESLKNLMKDLLAAIRLITHTSPTGETKPPTNALAFQEIENRLELLFLE